MATPLHKNENDALEAVRRLHHGYAAVASKLLIAHVVSDTIEILESAKTPKLKTTEQRLRNAIAGKNIHAEKQRIRGELTRIAAEIATKSESEIQMEIKNIETIHEPIISSNPELIVQLADLKRSAKNGRTSRPTPTPLTPPPLPPLTPPHTPAVGPNILGNTHITINTLPHSESIRGTVQIGETLYLSKDGITWSAVTIDGQGNFNIPIIENTNGTYTYSLKTRNGTSESSEETITVDISAVTHAVVAPTGPTITSGTTFTTDTPTIEGATTPGSAIEISIGGTVIGAGTTDASGNYSVTTSTIPAGANTVTVKATNLTDTTKVSQISQIINITTPLSLSPVTIDPGSARIEKLTSNPSILLENTVIGSRIKITDASSGRTLCDEIVRKHDASGKFRANLKGLDVRNIGPQDITIDAIDPGNPTHVESNDQTLEITEKKVRFTHPPKAALSKPGLQENNKNLNINLDDIIPGTKIQIENPRIPGGIDEFYANGKTFAQNIYNLDTRTPSTGPEELIIRMVDQHDTTNKSAEFRLTFEIDHPVMSIERPDIASISDKLTHGDDIKFQMSNAIDSSELVVTGPGLSTARRITVPTGNGSDFEIDLGIKAVPPLLPGKSYEYTVAAEDPKHPGTKKLTKVKIEIDYPVLTIHTPVISNAIPIEIRQGASSKGFLNVTNAVPGAEYILMLPNGSEIPAGKATGTIHAVSLNNLDISNAGPQTVIIKVKDPHHDTVPVLQSSIDIEVKKKVEAPKHLPQPVFRTPLDYAEGGGDIELDILNAVTHSEITVEYDTGGGRTVTPPLTVTADGNLKLPLAGFETPAGTSNITVTYRNPVSGISQTRTISMHIAPRPDIERPEGLQDETDINTKPFDVKIGKIKPGQTISVTGNTEMSNGTSIPATLRNNAGTYMLNIPAGAQSIKQNYTITVTDIIAGTTESFQIAVNVKVPPKANFRIDHHNFTHACEEAKINGTGSYRINGEPLPFTVKKSWGKYKTSYHGENFSAKTPEELYKAVKGHLDHHNQHEKDEYNAYWGLMPETPDHGKSDDHKPGKDGKEEKHEKGEKGHSEGNENRSGGGKFGSAVKTVLKTAAWPATGVAASVGYMALYGIGSVAIGPAIVGGAIAGTGLWLIRKLWRIKNPKKGGEEKAHH